MKKTSNSINFNLGASSLLLIFVILSLVSFAILSLSSAVSDKKLSQISLNKNNEYYTACNSMQEYLKEVDEEYVSNFKSSKSSFDYFDKCGEPRELTVPINDHQILTVEVSPLYPVQKGDPYYIIKKWEIENNNDPTMDLSLPVIK